MKVLLSIIGICLVFTSGNAEPLSVLAGSGTKGYSGDGGPAVNAQINLSESVLAVPGGAVYIADTDNHAVRRVNRDGQLMTVAMTGTSVDRPGGMALDLNRNLYVADHGTHSVYRIDPNGTCVAVVGNGRPGFSGDGGPAMSASLNDPSGVAVNQEGDIFIADTRNDRIRKIDHVTGTISTIAGNGTAGGTGDAGPATNAELNKPWGLALDAKGGLYVSEWEGHRIRYIDSSGTITRVAGTGIGGCQGEGGLASAGQLCGPRQIALDSAGTLFVADHWNSRVRAISPRGIISTVVGPEANLHNASGVTIDAAGNLIVADGWHYRVLSIPNAGAPGLFDGLPFPSSMGGAIPGDVRQLRFCNSLSHDYVGDCSGNWGGGRMASGLVRWTADLDGIDKVTLADFDGLLIWEPCGDYIPYEQAEIAKIDAFVSLNGGGLILVGSASQWNNSHPYCDQGPMPINAIAAHYGLAFVQAPIPTSEISRNPPSWASDLSNLGAQTDSIVVSGNARIDFTLADSLGHIRVVGLSSGAGRVLALAEAPVALVERSKGNTPFGRGVAEALRWASDRRLPHLLPPYSDTLPPSRVQTWNRVEFHTARVLSDAVASRLVQLFESTYEAQRQWLGCDMNPDIKKLTVNFVQAPGGFTGGDTITKGTAETTQRFVETCSHELGHEWHSWGGFPGAMQEGWGNYCTLHTASLLGYGLAQEQWWRGEMQTLHAADPNLTTVDLSSRSGDYNGYRKAEYVFRALEQTYGPGYVPRFLDEFESFVRKKQSEPNMGQFIDILSHACGSDLGTWFRSMGTTFTPAAAF